MKLKLFTRSVATAFASLIALSVAHAAPVDFGINSDRYRNTPNGFAGLDKSGAIKNYDGLGIKDVPASQWWIPVRSSDGKTTVPTLETQGENSKFTFGNNGTDAWSPQEGAQIGGHAQFDHGALNIYGAPYGGMNLGTLLTVNLTDRIYAGMRAGVAPNGLDGSGSISAYGDFDEVNFFNFAGNFAPRFIISPEYKDFENIAHTPTFSTDGQTVTFDKPLPSEWVSRLRANMHVATNLIGSKNSDPNPNNRQPIDVWVGDIIGWDPNGTWIKVAGWRVLGANLTPAAYVPGQAMGTSGTSSYVPAGTLDTKHFANFTKPAIFVGVMTKVFNRNTMCVLDKAEPVGDINNPMGKPITLVQECEADEIDIGSQLPDNTGRVHGITIAYNGPNKPTDDSYDMGLFGTNKVMLRIWGGADTVDINGDSIWVHGNSGVNADAAGSTQETAEFSSYADGANNMRLVTWNTRNVTKNFSKGIYGYSYQTLNLGYIVDGTPGTVPGDGNNGGGVLQNHIEFNPVNHQGGIGICGYGQTTCSLYANGDGSVNVNGSLTAKSSVYYMDSGAIGAQVYTDDNGDVVFGSGQPNARIVFTYPIKDQTRVEGSFNISRDLNISSANATHDSKTLATSIGGQGTIIGWNWNSGDASTYLVSVGSGTEAGFKFYVNKNGDTIDYHNPIVRIGGDGTITSKGNFLGSAMITYGIKDAAGNHGTAGYISPNNTGGLDIHSSQTTSAEIHTDLAFKSTATLQATAFSLRDDGITDPTKDSALDIGWMARSHSAGAPYLSSVRNELYFGITPDSSGNGGFYFGSMTNVASKKGLRIGQDGGLTTQTGAFASLGNGYTQGEQKYCTNCTSPTSGKTSVPVWWNGSTWTDALGTAVTHP